MNLAEIKEWSRTSFVINRAQVDWLIAEVERLALCNELEREIAYHAARSDIECYCELCPVGAVAYYDIQSPESDEEKGFTDQAVRYLESRKLLKRLPYNPHVVRPLDMEEMS